MTDQSKATKAQAIHAAEAAGLMLIEPERGNFYEAELMLPPGKNWDAENISGGQHSYVVSNWRTGQKELFWADVVRMANQLKSLPKYNCAPDCDCFIEPDKASGSAA